MGEAGEASAPALPPCPREVTCIGWELNARGDPAPRLANLRAAMDPAELSEAAAQLNLHLMRWRMLPQLQLERIGGLRCLLLGAGTLGCHVARDLLAWGVRHFTFVDCGRVAYSNPVRQPLFEFADASAEGGGRWKAQAAAEALKRIHPRVHTAWHTFRVPMPGHPLAAPEVEPARRDVAQLEALVASHDVTFLLTDTRESRWLPTVLAAAQGKLAVTVALGFDTFLAMRHGMRPSERGAAIPVSLAAAAPADTESVAASAATAAAKHTLMSTAGAAPPRVQDPRLGCYFCMDVVSPTDSTQNRTLDQQCTVTRPGVAPLSSALAVELVMALLHHPHGFDAAADAPTPLTASTVSPLGVVPHQIRGFLTHMHPLLATVPAFEHCPACGDSVVAAYRQKGFPFLLDVFCDTDTCGAGEPLASSTPSGTTAAAAGGAGAASGAAVGSVGILDRITGLHDLQVRAEAAMRRAEEEATRVRGNGARGGGRGPADVAGEREEDELDDWILGSE
jgi:ubiquitin-like modifier-activating enzyme ATG7